MSWGFVVSVECSFNHASRADGALPFLCFAKEKEAKERRLRAQVWLRQTSLTPRDFSGGLATCGFAASNMQALVPRKTALRSAVPAERAQLQPFEPNILYLVLQMIG